jgi:UPF0755 protein
MKRRIRSFCFIIFILIISGGGIAYCLLGIPNFLLNEPSKLLLIAPGTTFKKLQEKLVVEKYIARPYTFAVAAYLLNYPKKVMPGAYRLQPNMNNLQVLTILKRAAQEPIKLVLHEVSTKQELAEKISQKTGLTAADFEALLNDSAFLAPYGFTTDNVLAMFIPNTYEIYWTVTAEGLFKKMYREYQKFWHKERLEKAQALSLTPIQVYILASIVSKETNLAADYPMIAGVYMNRLRKNMLLQACPTALYAANDVGANRVLYSHLRADSPYNTYRYKGLPPGPIAMPPIAAIDAVLTHQVHDYLYFVSKNQYSDDHHFATTFQQHQHHIRQYRRSLREASARK